MSKFSEYFAGMEGSYVLIGGAASHILEDEAQLVPRATKDLDIILIVEALSDEFVSKFWSFVKNAGYEHIQKGSGKAEFYRMIFIERAGARGVNVSAVISRIKGAFGL